MRPEQIAEIRRPADPAIHPEGGRCAFTVVQMDLEADWYFSQVWHWDGSECNPFTSGTADTKPQWSPDGTMLAFLRAPDPNGKPQVAVMPANGGEPVVITDFALGVKELSWSPDGSQLAVVATDYVEELRGLDDDERERRPRRIARFPFRWDNKGWVHDRRDHVWLVDPTGTTEARCLTPGDHDETGIVWSPDGTEIAFLSPRHPEYGLESGTEVYTVGRSGGEPVKRAEVGAWSDVSFDIAGHLYAGGNPDHWDHPSVTRLYRLDSDGAVMLTGALDRNVVIPAPPVSPAGAQWLEDGTARLLVEDAGTIAVYQVSAHGEAVPLIAGRQLISGASFRADGTEAVYVASTSTNPGELYWWSEGESRRLTDLNGSFAESMVEPERFAIDHENVTIEGWIYMPPGDATAPVLLNIHGGPATQYGWGFFDEFQVYAGAGFAVVATNPRGSSGYGYDHVRAVVGQWQSAMPPDLRDLLAAVDAAAAVEPRLDTDRVGVMGGSYGGLATVRVIAADQRYRSAVAERGVYSFNSFSATSDIGPWFTEMYLGRGSLDSPPTLWDASSIKGFSAITTPTLVIHSEDDFRCPIEQAEQLFVALLRSGTTTELLRFPAPESHELSRSGKPRHRVERFEAIIAWHDRFLST